MKPYYEHINLANRWQKTVDYGSVVSAWSPIMFELKKQAGSDKDAHKLLSQYRQTNNCAEQISCTACGACYKYDAGVKQ